MELTSILTNEFVTCLFFANSRKRKFEDLV